MKTQAWLLLAAYMAFLVPGLSAKERPGASVVITLKDGKEMKGELYAVREDALSLVDPQGQSESIALTEVRQILLKKRTGRSVKTGAIIGSVAATSFALATMAANSHGGGGAPQAEEIAALSAIILLFGAVPGGLAGWIAGEASRDRTFVIEGLSGEPLWKVLHKLSKFSRAPGLR